MFFKMHGVSLYAVPTAKITRKDALAFFLADVDIYLDWQKCGHICKGGRAPPAKIVGLFGPRTLGGRRSIQKESPFRQRCDFYLFDLDGIQCTHWIPGSEKECLQIVFLNFVCEFSFEMSLHDVKQTKISCANTIRQLEVGRRVFSNGSDFVQKLALFLGTLGVIGTYFGSSHLGGGRRNAAIFPWIHFCHKKQKKICVNVHSLHANVQRHSCLIHSHPQISSHHGRLHGLLDHRNPRGSPDGVYHCVCVLAL